MTGRVRLRVVKVSADQGCKLGSSAVAASFPSCFGSYVDVASEDKTPYPAASQFEQFEYISTTGVDYAGALASTLLFSFYVDMDTL